jgi:hypothetical protein
LTLFFFVKNFDRAEYGLVQPDHFHPPFIVDCTTPDRRSKDTVILFSYNRFSAEEHAVLYNALSNYDGSSLYNETSVTQSIDIAVASGHIKNKLSYLVFWKM